MIAGDSNALTGRTTSEESFGRPPRRQAESDDPLLRRSEDLIRLVKEMKDEPGARAVHHLRTTIRRVEALLPDAQASGAERKVRKQLDRLRRRAGKVRDVDVHQKALNSLPRTLAVEASDALRDALEKSRQKRQKRLVRALENERDRGLVKRLRRVVARAAVADTTGEAGARVIAAVLAEYERAWQAASPLGAGNLHGFRIATKRLRYRAETVERHPTAAVAVRELKRVQDAIGSWHDWVTLGESAEELAAGASPLLAAVRARIGTELDKAKTAIERVGQRLQKLRVQQSRAQDGPVAARKGVRRVTAGAARGPQQSTGASA